MTSAEWIAAANKLLKADPNLTYQQAEQQLAADGHKRPSGITQKGSSKSGRRFGPKARRTAGQDARRVQQERTSTEAANQRQQTLAQQREEQQGIAQAAGLPEPHREHLYSQDISGELREGAPGDYVENVPEDIAAAKTALEQRIRTRYGGRYAVVIGVNGLRVIPKQYFDELVSPDDLPGIDIDETQDLDQQINVLKSITKKLPETLGGFQTEKPSVTVTGGSVRYKPKPLEGIKTDATVSAQTPVTPKQDLAQPVLKSNLTAEEVRNLVGFNENVQTGLKLGLQFASGAIRLGKTVLTAGAVLAGMK